MSYLDELQEIFYELFDDAPKLSSLTDASVSDEWDSFMQVQIVLSVEEKYGVNFSLEEIEGLNNVGEFIELIKKYNT